MKLEVGMYCYNKTNRKLGIGEIISFPIKNNVNIKYKNNIETISIENVEASHNIIDLLQVGDYVLVEGEETFLEVECIDDCKGAYRELYFDKEGNGWGYWNENIKSIVTKEQLEAMAYKVV